MPLTQSHQPRTSSHQAQGSPSRSHTGRRLALLVAGLTVATGTAVFGWIQLSGGDAELRPATSGSPVSYQPGGSVYNEQVPDSIDWSVGYGPASSTYREQVPSGYAAAEDGRSGGPDVAERQGLRASRSTLQGLGSPDAIDRASTAAGPSGIPSR